MRSHSKETKLPPPLGDQIDESWLGRHREYAPVVGVVKRHIWNTSITPVFCRLSSVPTVTYSDLLCNLPYLEARMQSSTLFTETTFMIIVCLNLRSELKIHLKAQERKERQERMRGRKEEKRTKCKIYFTNCF